MHSSVQKHKSVLYTNIDFFDSIKNLNNSQNKLFMENEIADQEQKINDKIVGF